MAGGAVPAAASAAPGGRGSFGQWLRGQREARGVDLAAIAESSKISMRYLEALEQDRFEVLPAPVFVRGFLKEYSRVVGLDADEVVNLFLVSAPRIGGERRTEGVSRGSSARPATARSGLLVVVLIAVVLVAVVLVSYWLSGRSARRSVPQATPAGPVGTAPAAAPVRQAPQVVVAAAPPATATPELPAAPPEAVPSPEAASAIVPTIPMPSPQLSDAVAPAANAPLVLVLAFQEDCWVETRVDDGRRASELRAGGETLRLEAKESIVLTLGNGPAVKVELNGRALALPIEASRLVRNFRIDRALLGGGGPGSAPVPGTP